VGSDAAVDGRLLPEEATVRAPRVFRVDNPAPPASEQAADRLTVSKTRTRRRRVLHGEVITIRRGQAAVRWIRKAIAEYGISASEMGL
jgi:hypothetical protein